MRFHNLGLDNQVKAKFCREIDLAHSHIDVSVRNGIVYLSGNVSQNVHDRAISLVKTLESVAAVIDRMTIAA